MIREPETWHSTRAKGLALDQGGALLRESFTLRGGYPLPFARRAPETSGSTRAKGPDPAHGAGKAVR